MLNDQIRITLNQLSKHFNDVDVLKDISLDFKPAHIHGLIGPEGAGKTTLMRLLTGLLKPSSGSISYYVNDELFSLEQMRSSIAYMPQTQSLYADLSVNEHLEFFKAMYQIPNDTYEQRKEDLLHITRLKEFASRPAGKLSGGMYKKLGLMCSLLRNPSVILLDEPTNGVDPISRREFWDLLYRLLDQKVTIIISTAYMDEAEKCSAVHLFEKGLLLDSGEPQELLAKNKVSNFDQWFIQRNQQSGVADARR